MAFFLGDHFASNHTKPNVHIQLIIYIINRILLNCKGNAEFIDGYDVYV